MTSPLPGHPAGARHVRWSYRELEGRTLAATLVLLLGLAGVAWWVTVDTAGEMSPMVSGLADVGRAMPFDMSAALFMAVWLTMMVAMMFPTVAPIVLLHRLVMRRRGDGPLPSAVFALGYLTVWTALGIVPLLVLYAFRQVTEPSGWVTRMAGAVLVLAGAYQFSRWKDTCLRACRSPMTFLVSHDFGTGLRRTFRTGVAHGLYCAGCCWALMAVLFTVGLMNLSWMAGIAAVFLAEKTWRHGVALTRVVGVTVVLLGLLVLARPSILSALSSAAGGQSRM
ncbi:DUF2182 domain-containing protein [Geodermatophilus sp. URMC 64]